MGSVIFQGNICKVAIDSFMMVVEMRFSRNCLWLMKFEITGELESSLSNRLVKNFKNILLLSEVETKLLKVSVGILILSIIDDSGFLQGADSKLSCWFRL